MFDTTYPGLNGKLAIVCGGAAGIGRMITSRLIAHGTRVVVVDINAALFEETAGESQRGGLIDAITADVSSEASIEKVFSAHPAVDVVINSAGINGFIGPLHETPFDALDRLVAVNIHGVFLSCKAAIRRMRGRPGAIVNLASTAALVGSARLGAYAMTKAAVVSMTRSFALSTAKQGIRVNAICPGSIETELFAETVDPARPDAHRLEIANLHPLRRIGSVDEVADAALFLASDAATFITGVNLPVDGGRTA